MKLRKNNGKTEMKKLGLNDKETETYEETGEDVTEETDREGESR